MTVNMQVGDFLLDDRPRIRQALHLRSEPYSENWSRINTSDGISVDRKIHDSGWNFFFLAGEVRAAVFGAMQAKNIRRALRRILKKVRRRNFNCLEVTAIHGKRFLGIPYLVVSAHSRHIQQSRTLAGNQERRTNETDAAWARG